jgi:hypothetical protein
VKRGAVLRAELDAADTLAELSALRLRLLAYRKEYLSVETIADFYGDAINTRTSERLAGYLRACDFLAARSMNVILAPLGKKGPPVLTYVDRGAGASILKAGLKLWDGRSSSPVAAIKIVRHNLQRPTSLLHETGHQIAAILGWNEELAAALHNALRPRSPELAALWSSWASEIAGDAFAFGHTGFASLAALHDVLATDTATVLGIVPYDPHPVSYLRVLLGRELCRRFFGSGVWDPLARAWVATHSLQATGASEAAVLEGSKELLPLIVDVVFEKRFPAFGGKALSDLLDPTRVRPDALAALELDAGKALYTSSHWLETECIRLLALTGYRAATEPARVQQILKAQEDWMLRLGGVAMAA